MMKNRSMLPDAQLLRVLTAVERSGLFPRPGKRPPALLLPSMRICAGDILEHGALPLGMSRLGGCPDLPQGLRWPRVEVPHIVRDKLDLLRHYFGEGPLSQLGAERVLPFLCQINLAEVAPLDVAGELPSRGLLLFYYDVNLDMWLDIVEGNPPKRHDMAAWRVEYVEDTSRLQQTFFPPELAPEQAFWPYALSFRLEWTLPPLDSPLFGAVAPPLDRYLDLLAAVEKAQPEGQDPRGRLHRMLGHALPIQADVTSYLAFVTLQRPPGDYASAGQIPGLPEEGVLPSSNQQVGGGPDLETGAAAAAQALKTDPAQWHLLLQLDSDPEMGMQWVDQGSLYFCVKREDLAAQRFSEAAGVVQFY